MHTYTHTHTHTYIAGDRKADGGVQKPKKDQDIHSSKPNANRLKTQEEPMFQFKSKDRKEWIYYLDSPQGGGAPSHSVLFGPSTDRMRSTHIRDSDRSSAREAFLGAYFLMHSWQFQVAGFSNVQSGVYEAKRDMGNSPLCCFLGPEVP